MRAKRPMTTIYRLQEIPSFTSEAEEQHFWETHELDDVLWDQAEPFEPGELPPPRPGTTSVMIHLDPAMLRRIKALARRRHQSYQALLEEFVAIRLAEEERKTG